MSQAMFDELKCQLSKEVWCLGAADQMISRAESERRWEAHKAARSQRFHQVEHDVMNVLIALEKLGYSITSPK